MSIPDKSGEFEILGRFPIVNAGRPVADVLDVGHGIGFFVFVILGMDLPFEPEGGDFFVLFLIWEILGIRICVQEFCQYLHWGGYSTLVS